MRALSDYLAKIPPEHANRKRFTAELCAILQPFADIQQFLANLPLAFDLDLAVGVQLDAVGAWVGVSRTLEVPIQNPWFSFDAYGLGFDQGYWQGSSTPGYLASLDDDTYRRLIRAVILANNTDGTLASITAALAEYFINPATNVFIIDETDVPNGDPYFSFDDPLRGFDLGVWFSTGGSYGSIGTVALKMAIGISGQLPTIVDLEILSQFLIPIKPAAVGVDWGVSSSNGAPVFGFDVENQFIGGFDVGAWGVTPDFAAQNSLILYGSNDAFDSDFDTDFP